LKNAIHKHKAILLREETVRECGGESKTDRHREGRTERKSGRQSAEGQRESKRDSE